MVSKTLVNQKMGTLTLFAFDQRQGLSEHTAPFDAVVQILDGKAELTIGGKVVPALAGQMVLMPADVPHALKAVEKFKMLLTMIRS
ncbi:MAG: cupin domain-containing protein [Nitrospinota bacterium]|nr:cupin domain-containing protein [Nitrospinota bacterium]